MNRTILFRWLTLCLRVKFHVNGNIGWLLFIREVNGTNFHRLEPLLFVAGVIRIRTNQERVASLSICDGRLEKLVVIRLKDAHHDIAKRRAGSSVVHDAPSAWLMRLGLT